MQGRSIGSPARRVQNGTVGRLIVKLHVPIVLGGELTESAVDQGVVDGFMVPISFAHLAIVANVVQRTENSGAVDFETLRP